MWCSRCQHAPAEGLPRSNALSVALGWSLCTGQGMHGQCMPCMAPPPAQRGFESGAACRALRSLHLHPPSSQHKQLITMQCSAILSAPLAQR